MSSTNLFLANAFIATLPFAIVGLINPAFAFSQFGLVEMEPYCLTLIRGYASSCLGYGILMWKLAETPEGEFGMLLASLFFNGAETLLQGHAIRTKAGFNTMIWSTFLMHGALGIWSALNLYRYNKYKNEKGGSKKA
jgi:hypothetical protein